MALDIANWLSDLGLPQYEKTFCDNDIDPDVLVDLTADDLIDLGVTSIGHRRKLLGAIARLKDAETTAGAGPLKSVAASRPQIQKPNLVTPNADN